jgi:hypothetical protein
VLLCLTFSGACRSADTAPPPPQPLPLWSGSRRLDSAQGSAEELARRVLDFAASDNINALKRLRISKQEYCDILWPELPGSRVPNLSCDFAWDQATLRSNGGLNEMMAEHRNRKYQFVSMRVRSVENYQTFNALKEPYIKIRDEKGVEREIRVFGSILELDGQYKLFSFVSD